MSDLSSVGGVTVTTEVAGWSLWAGGLHPSTQGISDVEKKMTALLTEIIYIELKPLEISYMNLMSSEHAT